MSGVNQSDWERFAYGPPASELPGVKTLVTDKSKNNLPSDIDRTPEQALPPGSATPNQAKPGGGGGGAGDGDSARGQSTRDIPEAYYNAPDGSRPTMKERQRTQTEPGEQHGNPTKFDYGTPTRRHMEGGEAEASDTEAGLKSKYPKKRQRWQKGKDKIRSRRYYMRNKSRHSRNALRRYYRLRNNRAFKRDRELRRKNPERFKRRRASSNREVSFVYGKGHEVGWLDTVGADGGVWFTLESGEQRKLPLMTFLAATAFIEEEDIESFFSQVDEHMMTHEGTTPEAVHAAADLWGIPWDNDEAFMDRTEELVGKRHLDEMTEEELEVIEDAITEGSFDPQPEMKVASGRSKMATDREALDKEALRSYKPTKKRRKKWRGVTRSKGRQYERKRKRSGKRRNYMKRYNRRRNRDPRVKRQRKLRRRQRSRWRKRGEWSRLADVLIAPEINFLYGPGQDDLGVLHAVSTFTGMATIRTTKKDAEPLISVPVPVLLESIVPLTEEDGEALFDLLEAELGQDFYDAMEFTLDDMLECAKLYGRNVDTSHFKSKCKDLIGDKSLEEASSDELALVNSVLITKLEGPGFERGKDEEVFEDAGDDQEVDPSDDSVYFGEVDRPPEDADEEAKREVEAHLVRLVLNRVREAALAGEVVLYDQTAPNKEVQGPPKEDRNYTPTSPTHYRVRPQDKKPGQDDAPDAGDYAQRANPPSGRVTPHGEGEFSYYDGYRTAEDWEAFAQREAREFEVEIGQPIWYGKYKNKKGVIKGFKTNDKGDTIIVVEQVPNPTGRKKPKELKLFRVRPRKVDPEGGEGKTGDYMDHPTLELEEVPYLDAPVHNVRAAVAEKYKHIDFKPPESVAKAAEKGLEYRQKASPSNRGGLTTEEAGEQGIGSGVQRAVNLKNRDDVTPETINRMVGFFARHEKNKNISEENKGEPWNDKGYVAWLLWGGDPGKTWANKIKGQMEKADEKAKKSATGIDDFDWFGDEDDEPELSPELRAVQSFEQQVGKPSQVMPLTSDLVRDRRAISMVGGKFQYVAPHRAWFVYTGLPGSQARRLGARLFRNLVGRRNVPARLPALHQVPLWVGTSEGEAVRVDPPKTAASSSKENEPTNPELWEKVQKLTKGEIKSLTHNGETIEGPNDGKGFDIFPSAYCVPMDSEALTEEGWRTFGELRVGDRILAYDRVRDVLDWTPIEDLHFHPKAPTVRLKKQSLDVVCTPEHRWLHFRSSIHTKHPGDMEALWSTIQAVQQGHRKVSHVIRDEIPGFQHWWDTYRHCESFDEFFLESGRGGTSLVPTSEMSLEGKLLVSAPYVGGDNTDWKFRQKYRGPWLSKLMSMSPEALESFYAACVMCDGWQLGTTDNHGFSQKDPHHADAFELCAFLTGRRVRRRFDPDRGLSIFTTNAKRYIPLPGTKVEPEAEQPVWCPETKFGTWVMRQNGHVLITGNSNGWAVKTYNSLGGGWKAKSASGIEQLWDLNEPWLRMASVGKHKLPPLPYAKDALEPYISEDTLTFHHDKHHKGYVDGLNQAEEDLAAAQESGDFGAIRSLNAAIAFNGSGHFLHSLYWKCLTPPDDYEEPSEALVEAVEEDFGSWDVFRSQMRAATEKVRGSGWSVLLWTPAGLRVLAIMNHENQMLLNSEVLLTLDAWEHAYYLDYQNDRGSYFDALFDNTINWPLVESRLDSARSYVKEAAKSKKDVGKGGLDEWFSGHGDDDGDARWGDWVAISPVEKTLDSGKKVKPGDIVGPCGISDDPDWKEFTKDGEDPLKCMPRNKAHDMPKKERAELAKKKQRAEKKDKNKGKEPTRTETFSKDDDKKKKADEDGSYMSAQHLHSMAEHAEEMLSMIDEHTPLPDWAESQITWATTSLTGVYEYMFHGRGRNLSASGHWTSPSYMTIQRLWEIKDHATEMLTRISEQTRLPDWAESKISQSAYWVLNVYEYLGHNPRATKKTAATIVDLITRTGPDVHDRAKSIGTASLVRARPDTGMWLFNVKGRTDTYRVRVKGIRKGNVKNLTKADVKVSCSCPFWRWQGPEHWGKKNGFLYGRPRGTATYPKIMDPPGNHWVCKHVLAALRLARNYRFASDALGFDQWFSGEVGVTSAPAPLEDAYAASDADWDAFAGRVGSMFEAPPTPLATLTDWATTLYANHVLYHTEQSLEMFQGDGPVEDAQAEINAIKREWPQKVERLREGEKVVWAVPWPQAGSVGTYAVGIKYLGTAEQIGETTRHSPDERMYLLDYSPKRVTFRKRRRPRTREDLDYHVNDLLDQAHRKVGLLSVGAAAAEDAEMVEGFVAVR